MKKEKQEDNEEIIVGGQDVIPIDVWKELCQEHYPILSPFARKLLKKDLPLSLLAYLTFYDLNCYFPDDIDVDIWEEVNDE